MGITTRRPARSAPHSRASQAAWSVVKLYRSPAARRNRFQWKCGGAGRMSANAAQVRSLRFASIATTKRAFAIIHWKIANAAAKFRCSPLLNCARIDSTSSSTSRSTTASAPRGGGSLCSDSTCTISRG